MKATLHRVDRVVRFGLQTFGPAAVSVALSWLVIRRHGAALWGAWVSVTLVLNLLAHGLSWGNRDDVLRRLSRDGADVQQTVLSHLRGRLLALLGPAVVALLGASVWSGWSLEIVGLGAFWLGLRAICQSAQAPVLHNKTFLSAAMNDVSGAAVPLMAVWLLGASSVEDLLRFSLLGETLRALLYLRLLPWWRATTRDATQLGAVEVLKSGAPFVMLSGVTLIASRIDLYCVALQLSDREVAHYQVMMNLLLTCASLGGVVILPFSREIYQREATEVYAWVWRTAWISPVIAAVMTAMVTAVMRVGYQLPMSTPMATLAAVYLGALLPHTIAVPALFRLNRERLVVWASAGCAATNLGLNLVLLPRYGLEGALAASAAVMVGLSLLYGAVLWRAARDT